MLTMDAGLDSHLAAIFVQSAEAHGKELLFVKLTDAALRGLEEAARRCRGQTGFLSFDGPASELQLPGGASFAFTVSDAVQGSDQLDLVQPTGAQRHHTGHPTVGRLGALHKKLTVQAKDDVYSNTKEKITQADQNEKRVRTKELKSNNGAKQRLMKRSLDSGASASSGTLPPKRPTTPLGNSGGGTNTRPTPPYASQSLAASRNLRDHVIHLLALRPYNQAELLIRLRQNGVTVESQALTKVLDVVGRLEPGRARYFLLPNLLAQVNLDWPLYSQQDKERLRDRKATYQQRLSTANSAPATAPAAVAKAANPATALSVGPAPAASTAQTAPTQPAGATAIDLSLSSSPSSAASPSSPPAPVVESQPVTASATAAPAPVSAPASDPAAAAPAAPASASDELKPISSLEDRARYKAEFDRDYPEYRRLWDRIRSVTYKAMDLEQQLDKQVRGSPAYEAACEKIIELYKHCHSQPEFRLDAEHFMAMEKRLQRIRQLIVDYDRGRGGPINR